MAQLDTLRTELLDSQPEVLWMHYKSIYLNFETKPEMTRVITEVYSKKKRQVDGYLEERRKVPKWYLKTVGDELKLVCSPTAASTWCSE